VQKIARKYGEHEDRRARGRGAHNEVEVRTRRSRASRRRLRASAAVARARRASRSSTDVKRARAGSRVSRSEKKASRKVFARRRSRDPCHGQAEQRRRHSSAGHRHATSPSRSEEELTYPGRSAYGRAESGERVSPLDWHVGVNLLSIAHCAVMRAVSVPACVAKDDLAGNVAPAGTLIDYGTLGFVGVKFASELSGALSAGSRRRSRAFTNGTWSPKRSANS